MPNEPSKQEILAPIPLPLTGGCRCGAIRYECTSKPVLMFLCHCRDCQSASGGAYVPVVLLKAKAFKLTQGALKTHAVPSIRGGNHVRGFCGECGSRLTGGQREVPGPFIGVTATSLDNSSWFKPTGQIFLSQAQTWDPIDKTIPGFELGFPTKERKT